ncbi:hypothetical protein NOCA2310081 [metagenome]|uniref:Uncharacterized protein n=1 Tax=metagenome TaxID=256318 RepID=A0A2P2C5B7_9ZZZZ
MLGHLSPGGNCRSGFRKCPRKDSNLRSRLRRAVLYPLSYGGSRCGDDHTARGRSGRNRPLISMRARTGPADRLER